MSATVTRLLPGTRSLVTLTDSMAATKLVQEELLRSKQTYTAVANKAAVAGQTRLPRLETIVRILGALGWVITAARRDD
jgi:hypothetical protein